MLTAKAPGKLYIAGEYAVVDPGYPAVLVTLDQFVTATITKSNDFGRIISNQYQNNEISWRREDSEMIPDNREITSNYITSAIRVTEKYASLKGVTLELFDLTITSELDNQNGKKYGLGSSAAVTVATIKVLNKFYHLNLSKLAIFKLAAIAHLKVQGNGSCGDIAAITYGGWIAYHSFNRNWLLAALSTVSLIEIINSPWPDLKIEELTLPSDLQLLIGWTASPASTSKLVDKVAFRSGNHQKDYQEFLQASQQCVSNLITAFKEGNVANIKAEIINNRTILNRLTQFTGVIIETPALQLLCDIANRHNAAAKSSGAGGGDCGIVLTADAVNVPNIISEWQANNIIALPLKPTKFAD